MPHTMSTQLMLSTLKLARMTPSLCSTTLPNHSMEMIAGLACNVLIVHASPAFMSLKEHHLRQNNVDNLATQAECKLKLTTYSGETQCWDFERFIKTHIDQLQTLADLTCHGHAGIDPRSNVQCLLNDVKTNALAAVKHKSWPVKHFVTILMHV